MVLGLNAGEFSLDFSPVSNTVNVSHPTPIQKTFIDSVLFGTEVQFSPFLGGTQGKVFLPKERTLSYLKLHLARSHTIKAKVTSFQRKIKPHHLLKHHRTIAPS